MIFGIVTAAVLLGYDVLWGVGQELRAFYYGKIAGQTLNLECTVCGCELDVPYAVDVESGRIRFIPDMTDVTVHTWTHEPETTN